jgi:hypothetical protein
MVKKAQKTDINGDSAETSKDGKPKRVIIRAKTPMAWGELLKTASSQAWRKLRIEIKIHDKLLAGKPASLDAANAMLAARGLDDFMALAEDIVNPTERAEAAAKIAKDEGLCEFSRREGHPGVYIPSNNLKAMLKENWSVLGLRVEVRGSRGALAEGIFVIGEGEGVEQDWIRVGDAPDGVHVAVAHTTGASGPVSSIKRHEYVNAPTLVFYVLIANAKSVSEKISDDELAKTLVHASLHGTGSCRSQGFGKFAVISVEEIEGKIDVPNS